MILFLVAFRKDKGIQEFFCEVDDLESGFDVLSLLASQGETILRAQITDESGQLDLPTELFYGQPFRVPIRCLERQWATILNKSTGKGSIHNIELGGYIRRLTAINQAQIDHANSCVIRLIDLQQRAQLTIINDLLKAKMVKQYQIIIDGHLANLAKVKAYQRINAQRFRRLEK